MNENEKDLIEYINNKIAPFSLSEFGKNDISVLLQQFDFECLKEAIDISFKNYINFDENGNITNDSVQLFLKKIGGIAHNNQLPPINKKIRHILNICNSKFNYFDFQKANVIMEDYIKALRKNGWSESEILYDLENETMNEVKKCTNWTQFRILIEGWTNSLLEPTKQEEQLITNNNLKIEKNYEIIKAIGSGSFGITYLAVDKSLDKNFVIKEFSCEMIDDNYNIKFFEKFKKEIKYLFDLHHENIVSIYDYVIDDNAKRACYIMEYINGKNIYQYLLENPNKVNEIFVQLIDAFEYLEKKNICHRDIRINNILVTIDGVLKLIDFGFVKNIDDGSTIHSATKLISYPYDWPEELRNKIQKYDNRTEIYFIGQLFKDILTRIKVKKFKYNKILLLMCEYKYDVRINKFKTIKKELLAIDKNNIKMV